MAAITTVRKKRRASILEDQPLSVSHIVSKALFPLGPVHFDAVRSTYALPTCSTAKHNNSKRGMSAPQCCRGLVHDCTAPGLAGGWAGKDDTCDHQRESSYAFSEGRTEQEEVSARRRPSSTTDDSECLARGRGTEGAPRTFECAMPAPSEADVLPSSSTFHCPQQRYQSQSSNTESSRLCRAEPPTPRHSDNANVLHTYRDSGNNYLHRCCIDDEQGKDCGGASSRHQHAHAVSTASVAAMAAAEVQMATAAAATAAADDGTIIGDELGGNGGPFSRAAVEAWDAAETWASALAAATGAVVAGRGQASVEESMKGIIGNEKGGGTMKLCPTTAVEPEHHHRRNPCVTNEKLPVGRGCSNCCRCPFSGNPSAMVGICQSAMHLRDSSILSCGNSSGPGEICQSPVRRRDSAFCSKSKVLMGGDAIQSVGCDRPAMNTTRRSSALACPRYKSTTQIAAMNDNDAVFTARTFDDPRRGKTSSTVVTDPTTVRSVVVVGEAAAVVLARINRGEELWGRRARRAGLAALRTRRTRAGLRKARGAIATEHWKRTLRIRGLRILEARVKRQKGRAAAAAADAESASVIADAFARAHRKHRLVAMLQR